MYKILLPLLILFISCGEDNGNSNNECSLALTKNGVEQYSNTVDCSNDGYNTYSVSEKELEIASSWGEWIVMIEFENAVNVSEGGYSDTDFSKFRILQTTSGYQEYHGKTPNEPFDFTITQYGGVGGYMQAEFTGNLLGPSIRPFNISISARIVD